MPQRMEWEDQNRETDRLKENLRLGTYPSGSYVIEIT